MTHTAENITEKSVQERVGWFVMATPIVVVLCAPSMILHAWVTMKLWNWYVTPFFHTPSITWPVALGLRMCLGSLTFRVEDLKPSGMSAAGGMWYSIFKWYSYPLFALAVGWILLWIV